MIKTELAPGIVSFEGLLENPSEFINDLEGLVTINNLQWSEATQSDGKKESSSEVTKSARNCFAMSLPPYNDPGVSGAGSPFEVHKFLDENLLPAFTSYTQDYSAVHWTRSEGWQILKYGVDNYFVNHYDDSKQYPRTISMSYYLNNDYEGGEIEFSRFNLKIKPKANQAIFFPSNYVYNHTVHPVTSGIRYAVVGWWE